MSKGGPAEIILETVDSLKGEKDDYATSESESEMVGGKGRMRKICLRSSNHDRLIT